MTASGDPTAPRLLVAECDPRAANDLQHKLENLGFDAESAGEASVVLSRLDSGQDAPDLLLIDVGFDGGRGIETCESVHRHAPRVPVVTLHGADELSSVGAALAAGATDFLTKPIDEAALRHRVTTALAGWSARRAGSASSTDSARPDDRFESPDEFNAAVTSAIAGARANDEGLAVLSIDVSVDDERSSSDVELTQEQFARALGGRLFNAIRAFDDSAASSEYHVTQTGRSQFAVLIPCGDDASGSATKLANYVFGAVGSPAVVDGNDYGFFASVGVSLFPNDGAAVGDLLQSAQTASYCARQEGRNSVQFYTESMSRWAFERLTLENSLKDALDNEEFVVFYQPRVAIPSRRIVGFEALIRWQHPQLGMVSPAQFIPLAEATGLVVPMGEWVLRTACKQAKDWQERGLPPIRMSVNLSAEQFRQANLHDTVARALKDTGLDAQWLELELTESMIMNDAESTIGTLNSLKSAGIHLSIDDFGTGYSSLSYLKRFPIDALKIDRSFVRDITSSPDDAAIATSIILMGNSLNLSVVAEGVEDESQLSFLQVLQCHEVQGYLFSPPVPAEQAENLLRRSIADAA